MTNTEKLSINSEFDELQMVIMASPKAFIKTEPINVTQARFFENDLPATELLIKEQEEFAAVLNNFSVEIIWLPIDQNLPYQLNTRDIGFVVHNKYFKCSMSKLIRFGEPEVAEAALLENKYSLEDIIPVSSIEGGDVLVDGDKVFVGISERTKKEGFISISEQLAEIGVSTEPIALAEKVLHLDVAFNIVAPELALIHSKSIVSLPDSISKKFKLIEVSDNESARLGTNVFVVRPGVVVADSRNQQVIQSLEKEGIKVIPINYEMTSRIGGSFRCMTLPLNRSF